MNAFPAWFAEPPDFAADRQAFDKAYGGDDSAGVLHRAARHSNWKQSTPIVQTWTQADHVAATQHCNTNLWDGVAPLTMVSERNAEFVFHRPVRWLPDSLKTQCLNAMNDPAVLRKVAIQFHAGLPLTGPTSPRAVWLGSITQADNIGPFDPSQIHTVIAAFGLWHFGGLPPDDSGAVLRIVYRLSPEVPLFKPDWRHGYPGFYFAYVPSAPTSGLTRDLRSGQLRCKEWLARATDIDPYRDIVSASCVVPAAMHNHYELPPAYWSGLAQEIKDSPGAVQ